MHLKTEGLVVETRSSSKVESFSRLTDKKRNRENMGTSKNFKPILALLLSCILDIATAKFVIRLRPDGECPMPGYFRDETDCRKFYRCAEHPTGVEGQNYITRSEFGCPPGTIFDETLSNCNHIMFVQNIPPGCDISSSVDSNSNESGGSNSIQPPSSTAKPEAPTSAPPSQSRPSTLPPPLGLHLSQPSPSLVPPEHNQMTHLLPEAGHSHTEKPPMMLPSIIPPGQQQMPMFPSINIPQFPDGQVQPPMIPGFPSMPGGSGDHLGHSPMFPFINVPQFPDGQVQPPMIPGFPSGGPSGQQQNLLSSFNFPQISNMKLPSTLNLHTVSMLPKGQFQLNAQNGNKNPAEQNLQTLTNSPLATVTITAQKPIDSKPSNTQTSSWITPQQFPGNSPVNPLPVQGGMGSTNNEGGGWIVPDNFPTFYSSFARSPYLFSQHTSNISPFIMI